MFADLCYFPVRSVQLTFVFLVLPCLLLGYLGQAAYLMEHHSVDLAEQAFFTSVPSGVFWPVFLVANLAALIASRTMTTATFSCIKQSTALGCFPRLKIVHTSRKFMGQIYIPVINWFLLVACLVLVCSISSITEIGNAYGNAYFLVRVEFFPSILISTVHQLSSLLFVSILFNDVMNVLKKKSE
ncbi:OSMOTIC STRESS POTASSIUM TRANSPORTER [Salix viminalis]|uniref:OSMOTIC STRESS POTASSIUM TRANSPORTER n=1 Tax=Salix viminalis TaxID=40686 RepID=A0A9Q0T8K0_SALVM|nr:OSMOTIC STRESS POTASSIUM TRANSPORTER [Salix viminalis]